MWFMMFLYMMLTIGRIQTTEDFLLYKAPAPVWTAGKPGSPLVDPPVYNTKKSKSGHHP